MLAKTDLLNSYAKNHPHNYRSLYKLLKVNIRLSYSPVCILTLSSRNFYETFILKPPYFISSCALLHPNIYKRNGSHI